MKILGVDDNLDITEALQITLQMMGHDAFFTNSGKEAVDLIKNNSYDVILLDLTMPKFSGFDVIAELENFTSIRDLNIILFTASAINQSEINELIQKGALGVIKKPIEVDVLEKEIIALLS